MRHIEEKVVLAEPNLLTVVVELRHAIRTNHNESLIVKPKFAFGQRSKVLHHHQIVAITYTQGVVTSSRNEVFNLHNVRFLLFWLQISLKISEIYCSISLKIRSITKKMSKKETEQIEQGQYQI